ncbi:hypothetical protein F5Y17DRAFT_463286 [Xylariaceae sp. FL0594]|nr:hypothetical protein F5Y17DRAFT_463286 [Xylariaceae sp. FL0594]
MATLKHFRPSIVGAPLKHIVPYNKTDPWVRTKNAIGQALGTHDEHLHKLRRRVMRFRLGRRNIPVSHEIMMTQYPPAWVLDKTLVASMMCSYLVATRYVVLRARPSEELGRAARKLYDGLTDDPHNQELQKRFMDLTRQVEAARRPGDTQVLHYVIKARKAITDAHVTSLECRIIQQLALARHLGMTAKGPLLQETSYQRKLSLQAAEAAASSTNASSSEGVGPGKIKIWPVKKVMEEELFSWIK